MSLQLVVRNEAGQLITSSRTVAEVFQKEHKHVLRDIRELDCTEEFQRSNFGPNKIKVLNGTSEETDSYDITEDGWMFLVMGYRGEKAASAKQAFIAAFRAMRDKLQALLPQSHLPPQIALLQGLYSAMMESHERVAAQEAAIQLVKGDVAALQDGVAESKITSAQTAGLSTSIAHRATSLGLRGVPKGKAMSSMKAAIKERFFAPGVRKDVTFKDIRQSDLPAALELVANWRPS